MVGRSSPKPNMMARGSPKLCRFLPTGATKKKPSPKSSMSRGMFLNVYSCFVVNFVLFML
jgi:hypothetical protein